MKTKFRNKRDYILGEDKHDMEHPKGKSMTIPDEAYTVQELMNRMISGIPTHTSEPYDIDDDDEVGHDDEDLEAFSRLDITEQEEILVEAEQVVKESQKMKKKRDQEESKKKKDEEFEKQYQERKKKEEEDNAQKSVATQH